MSKSNSNAPKIPQPPQSDEAAAIKTVTADSVDVLKDVSTPELPKTEKAQSFYICKGKSLTTRKGILGPGEKVQASYLIDGDEGLKRHRKSGVIVKK